MRWRAVNALIRSVARAEDLSENECETSGAGRVEAYPLWADDFLDLHAALGLDAEWRAQAENGHRRGGAVFREEGGNFLCEGVRLFHVSINAFGALHGGELVALPNGRVRKLAEIESVFLHKDTEVEGIASRDLFGVVAPRGGLVADEGFPIHLHLAGLEHFYDHLSLCLVSQLDVLPPEATFPHQLDGLEAGLPRCGARLKRMLGVVRDHQWPDALGMTDVLGHFLHGGGGEKLLDTRLNSLHRDGDVDGFWEFRARLHRCYELARWDLRLFHREIRKDRHPQNP